MRFVLEDGNEVTLDLLALKHRRGLRQVVAGGGQARVLLPAPLPLEAGGHHGQRLLHGQSVLVGQPHDGEARDRLLLLKMVGPGVRGVVLLYHKGVQNISYVRMVNILILPSQGKRKSVFA